MLWDPQVSLGVRLRVQERFPGGSITQAKFLRVSRHQPKRVEGHALQRDTNASVWNYIQLLKQSETAVAYPSVKFTSFS